MVAPYPPIDRRRAKKLVAELKRLAEVFVPRLRGVAEEDSASRAVVEIAGRLAGQVIQRLDKVPRRDAIAFFHTLDIPQEAPRSARVPLIFTLSDKRRKPVHAAARIQVAASAPNGEDVIFETSSALNLTPTRLKYLAAVDTKEDRIEEPPPQLLQLAPMPPPTSYQLVTLANADSDTLQIAPAIGLDPGDVIGIHERVYRLKETKDGLVTLHEQDRLEQAVEAGTEVRKVTRFDAFQQRDLQRHLFYVGHAELLNLEQPSIITLGISPPAIASRLVNLGLAFELYGTDDKDVTRWHPFEEKDISVRGGEILLHKEWTGSVDEIKIDQHKNRWLRVRVQLDQPIRPRDDFVARIIGFTLGVKSKSKSSDEKPSSASEKSGCRDAAWGSGGEEPSSPQDNTWFSCTIKDQGESQTIKQAFHNANPLPLTTQFLPFGPEPLRFDHFALAAPEALSKKGAKVALAINLVDASPAVMTLALSSSQTRRGFAVGVNGKLQVFELKADEPGVLKNWKELGFPEKPPEGQGSDNVFTLRLDHTQAPRAVEIAQEKFVVVVRDEGDRHWVANVSKTTKLNEIWKSLPPLPGQATMADFVLIPKPQSLGSQPQGAALFAVSDKGLYQLIIQSSGVPDNQWNALSNSCDLREGKAADENKLQEFITQFKDEFKLKKEICAVLIVEATIDAATDTTKWVIAGFDDKEVWKEEQINDPNHRLIKEVKKVQADRSASKISELATSVIGRSLPSEKSFSFDKKSDHTHPKPRLVPVHSRNWPSPPEASSLRLVLLDVDGRLWLGKLARESNSQWNNAIDWRLLPNKNNEWLASTEVRPVAANVGKGNLAIFAAKENRALFGLTAPMSNLDELKEIPPPTGLSSFIVQAQSEILCDPSHVDSSTTQPFALAFGETGVEVTSPVIALWEHDEFKRIPYPTVYSSSLKPSGLLVPMSGSNPPVVFINGPREKIYRRVLTHDDLPVQFELFDTVISTGGVEFDYLELISGDDSENKIVGLTLALQKDDDLRVYALSRSEGGLSNKRKYNLYRMTSELFTGEVVEEDDGKKKTLTKSSKKSSKQLKLDVNDLVTTEKSILTIDNTLYLITEVDRYRVATLNAPLAVGQVTYTPSQRHTDTPVKVGNDQIATLLKLTNQTMVPPASLTKIRFEEGADPLTQLIHKRDQQPPDTGNVWLLLNDHWNDNGIPKGHSATMLSSLGTGDWSEESLADTEQNPELSWEYYNGDGWRLLDRGFNDTTNHLAASGRICFCVPHDITPTEISGQEDYWIRARLVGGDYGRAKYVVTTEDTGLNTATQTITVDTTDIRAPEIVSIAACFELTGTVTPQQVLTENNLAVIDQTPANSATLAQFELFEGAASIDTELETDEQGRALYLGFTKPYNVNPLALFIDADEPDDPGNQLETFELLFEVLELNQRWRKVAADDRTGGFQHRGMVNLFIDIVPQRARLFGRDLFWLRVRPGGKGDQWKPLLNGIYINAAEAEQAKSVRQEILGSSTGEPDQRFFLSKTPVVSNSLELRVRETLSEDERLELEQVVKVRRDSGQPESDRATKPVITTYPDIPGRWVLWRQVDSFVEKDGDARVYQLDPASGEVRFGNDEQGKIPPAGQDAVRAIGYQNGGGEQGNVMAFSIEGLKSSIESVDKVTNPIDATGGVDALDVDQLVTTAPDRLRHRQQALTPVDIEALAVAWSSEIVRARCLTPDEPAGPIKVFIARRTGERCPKATRVECDALARYLREQGWGALGERSILVLNPDYVPLSVKVEILAESPGTVAAVEKEARERLLRLLHPIDGGPDGSGWPFGRGLWKSDLFRALADVPGLDRVEDTIKLEPESLDNLPPSSLICSDEKEVKVTVKVESGGGAA